MQEMPVYVHLLRSQTTVDLGEQHILLKCPPGVALRVELGLIGHLDGALCLDELHAKTLTDVPCLEVCQLKILYQFSTTTEELTM